MRIGILAPEFPPMLGGMAELARGLASALAETESVRVFSFRTPPPPDDGAPSFPFPVEPMTGRPWIDGPALAAEEDQVDLWLSLNAGSIPTAASLRQPFFAYLHGNDFINPWLRCGPRWLESRQRPYVADLRHYLRRRAVRTHLHRVRHVLTNSRQTARLITERLGLDASRISVAYPGVGEAFFQDREPDDGETLRILTVTRLSRHTRRKNVDGVLRALAKLGDAFPWSYTVVGDGDDRERLEDLARELGIAAQVTFLGSVSFDELLAAYRRADLFILASRATKKDVEGFGIVYIEASAGGVPVICSREGGATDAVRDGVNGLLIETSDPASIAAGIERFQADRERFSPAAARAMAEEFRWPKIGAQVLDILKSRLE